MLMWQFGERRSWLAAMLLLFVATVAPATAPRHHAYGSDARQAIDFYPSREKRAPLIIYVHGGGWSAGSRALGADFAAHFQARGFAVATVGYRLLPSVKVEDQLGDLAASIRWMSHHASKLHADPGRIILIGHSSGAHLAAMIATDPRWLEEAGVRFDSIRAVVSLDGAGLDVPGIMAAGADASPFYAGAFGRDPDRRAALSPTSHAAAPNAPCWLFLYDGAHNPAAGYFARHLADALIAAGAAAQVVPIGDTTHMKLLHRLGASGDIATGMVDRFLGEAVQPVGRGTGN